MVGPTAEKLTGMGLLGKKDSVQTEILYLRDDKKRQDYLTMYTNRYKEVD